MEKKMEIIDRVERRKRDYKKEIEVYSNEEEGSENYNIVLKKNEGDTFELVV
jgi:hypothetical protein